MENAICGCHRSGSDLVATNRAPSQTKSASSEACFQNRLDVRVAATIASVEPSVILFRIAKMLSFFDPGAIRAPFPRTAR
jgi:hypothetical protein